MTYKNSKMTQSVIASLPKAGEAISTIRKSEIATPSLCSDSQ